MTEDDNIPDDSENWTNLIDRGGLKHVNNVTYMLMAAMEIEVMPKSTERTYNRKSNRGNDEKHFDVMFNWALLSANWDEEVGQALLPT